MTDRLTKLKQLEAKLETALDECEGDKVAPLAKQYRETLREIDELEGQKGNNNDISDILRKRQIDGLPGAVRQNKS